MITRYVKISFSNTPYKVIQEFIKRIYVLDLYPISEISYNETDMNYTTSVGTDIRLYFKTITHTNDSVLLYWRKELDSSVEPNESSVLVDVLDKFVADTNYSYDIVLVDIDSYPPHVNPKKYLTNSINDFPEWSVGIVKRV